MKQEITGYAMVLGIAAFGVGFVLCLAYFAGAWPTP